MTDNGRRQALDTTAAQALLEQAERQRKIRQKPRRERAEARRQAARSRFTYDLPNELQDAIAHVAEQEGLSASAVAGLLLADALRRYREGCIVFSSDGIKRFSRSPKYQYTIGDETILAVLQGNQPLEMQEDEKRPQNLA